MKICGKCGHRNYSIELIKKKRVCEECGDKMDEVAQCFPEIGGKDDFKIRSGGCHTIRKKLLHDEEPWDS